MLAPMQTPYPDLGKHVSCNSRETHTHTHTHSYTHEGILDIHVHSHARKVQQPIAAQLNVCGQYLLDMAISESNSNLCDMQPTCVYFEREYLQQYLSHSELVRILHCDEGLFEVGAVQCNLELASFCDLILALLVFWHVYFVARQQPTANLRHDILLRHHAFVG